MRTSTDPAAVFPRFNAVGAALMRADLNNSHSGNMSLRDPCSPQRFFITASGAACGALTQDDIVPVRFSDLAWDGAKRPSTETNTHRRVLELPGVNACVHCHAKTATAISLESPQKPLFLQPLPDPPAGEAVWVFQPTDFFGALLIGAVTVGAYTGSVGSDEMQMRVPRYLRDHPLTLVRGHGPFARGGSLNECLCYLSVLENSARLAMTLRRRGIDLGPLQRLLLEEGPTAPFAQLPWVSRVYPEGSFRAGDPLPAGPFAPWQTFNFDQGLSAYAVGSMSCRSGPDEMVFTASAAAPAGSETPRRRLPVGKDDPADSALRLHRRIYARTPFAACVVAPAPLATAEATAVWCAAQGGSLPSALSAACDGPATALPAITPIDAEAAFYKVTVPVAPPAALSDCAPSGLLPEMLRQGEGCAAIAGVGVIAAGETLAQAVYRLSLMERIAYFRQEVHLNQRLLGGAAAAEIGPG